MAKKEKRRHLGRGLESLLGPTVGSTESDAIPIRSVKTPEKIDFPIDIEVKNTIQHVPIDQIEPNPYQPRMTWNDAELNDLCESIKANGLIQPILLRQTETGFQVIAGERRLRASKLAGLEKINALVRDASDEEMLELALVENIHRANLNPIERALAYQR